MAITHAFFLNTTVRQSDGQQLVMMRITSQRKSKYVDTTVYVQEKYFNAEGNAQKKNWIRRSHPQHELLNTTLGAWHERIETLKHRLIQANAKAVYTAQQVKDRLLGMQDETFSAFIEAYIQQRYEKKQRGLALIHQSVLNSLRLYIFGYKTVKRRAGNKPSTDPDPALAPNRPVIYFHQLTEEVVRGWETWLLNKPIIPSRPNPASRRNGVSDKLQRLHQMVYAYILKHKLPSESDPMRGMKLPKMTTQAERLTTAELILWENAKLPKVGRAPAKREAVRVLYLSSYYLHGIRCGDLISLRVKQFEQVWNIVDGEPRKVTRLYYTSDKRDKTKSILVEPYLLGMLEPYLAGKEPDDFVFPFIPNRMRHFDETELEPEIHKRVSFVNTRLKEVAQLIGVNTRITMHTARHKFADDLYLQSGDIYKVRMALGHTHVSYTERYVARFSQDVVDSANEAVYARRRVDESADPEEIEPISTETALEHNAKPNAT